MTVGDLKKMMVGLPDGTEIEIVDENTDEVYVINEISVRAFLDSHTENFNGTTGYWLQFTTNIELQSDIYKN